LKTKHPKAASAQKAGAAFFVNSRFCDYEASAIQDGIPGRFCLFQRRPGSSRYTGMGAPTQQALNRPVLACPCAVTQPPKRMCMHRVACRNFPMMQRSAIWLWQCRSRAERLPAGPYRYKDQKKKNTLAN